MSQKLRKIQFMVFPTDVFPTFHADTPDEKRFVQGTCVPVVTCEGKCSCRRTKSAHFVGHLPQTHHPVSFKLICFAGKGALSGVDLLCSFPCCFPKKEYRPDLFVQFLLRPQRPLLNSLHSSVRSRRDRLRSRHLPCLPIERRSRAKRT